MQLPKITLTDGHVPEDLRANQIARKFFARGWIAYKEALKEALEERHERNLATAANYHRDLAGMYWQRIRIEDPEPDNNPTPQLVYAYRATSAAAIANEHGRDVLGLVPQLPRT